MEVVHRMCVLLGEAEARLEPPFSASEKFARIGAVVRQVLIDEESAMDYEPALYTASDFEDADLEAQLRVSAPKALGRALVVVEDSPSGLHHHRYDVPEGRPVWGAPILIVILQGDDAGTARFVSFPSKLRLGHACPYTSVDEAICGNSLRRGRTFVRTTHNLAFNAHDFTTEGGRAAKRALLGYMGDEWTINTNIQACKHALDMMWAHVARSGVETHINGMDTDGPTISVGGGVGTFPSLLANENRLDDDRLMILRNGLVASSRASHDAIVVNASELYRSLWVLLAYAYALEVLHSPEYHSVAVPVVRMTTAEKMADNFLVLAYRARVLREAWGDASFPELLTVRESLFGWQTWGVGAP